jgi:hypothetical protein
MRAAFVDGDFDLAPLVDLSSVFEAGGLWDQLDRLKQELETEASLGVLTVGSAMLLTSALSVGYVFWTIRGGYLLATMLSTLPAWRMVDPLPVLDTFVDSLERRRKRQQPSSREEESLESLVNR